MTRLQLTDATRRIDKSQQLGPISLDFDLHGLTAVLGPNGAGKSLFLSLCHGTTRPSAGRVNWDGTPAHSTRHLRGYMLQNPVVLRRTTRANIDFALQSMGIPAKDRHTRVVEVLDRVQLTAKADTPAATLSGGELRRMNLARALITNPKVLLLDEPFAGLDPSAAAAMESLIVEAAKSTPVILSNHDLVQTRRIADRVLFFADGSLVENTLAADFFLKPESATAQNFLKGHLL